MNVNMAYYSAIGGRDKNEDSVSLLEGTCGMLAIVCDGLGGHSDGEIASRQAVATLNELLLTEPLSRSALDGAIRRANEAIFARQTPESAMKTTLAALWLDQGLALAAHVGDTRIYQIRKGEIIYQSMDHSVAQLAVLVGEIETAQLRSHPDRNKLVRALGAQRDLKIEHKALDVESGDRFLLCSDGFWEPVTEREILMTAAVYQTAEQWLSAMRKTAEKTPRDNHTAVAIVVNS